MRGVPACKYFSRTKIHEVERATEFVVRAESAVFRAPALVVATGGLSIPKMGATAFGYDVARQFGLKIRETRPASRAAGAGTEDRARYCDLAGVSTEVAVSTDDHVVPGQDADHSPGTERTGDPANLLLLERRASRSASTWRPTAMSRRRFAKPRSEMRPPSGSPCRDSCQIVLPSDGLICIRLPRGPIRH